MNRLKENIQAIHKDPNSIESLRSELEEIHSRIRKVLPEVARVSFVSYDPKSAYLYTYAESSTGIHSFSNYSFPLKASASLAECAEQKKCKTINDMPASMNGVNNRHSQWLLQQNFKSSYTVPTYNGEHFVGFIFFDSYRKYFFTESVQQELTVFCDLICFAVNTEYSLLNAILTSAELTKEFSPGYKKETQEHMERMSSYALLIAKGVADIYHLDDELIESIHVFSRLHDIGKSSLSTDLLLKPSGLANVERETMKEYVSNGILVADKIIENLGFPSHRCIEVLKSIVACHQEYLDGSGYPKGLANSDIPVPARIVTVANIFDALTSHRPYKQACSITSALLELEKMVQKGKLDSHCVNALRDHQSYLARTIKRHPEIDPSA
jgi:HD-GYP domain-containing protein (c-di-GMP phosphodiesterase class II)